MEKRESKTNILNYLEQHGETSPRELSQFLEISPQALFRHLKTLMHQQKIEKIGASPKVFYRLCAPKIVQKQDEVPESVKTFLHKNFFFVSPVGESYDGVEAMKVWCERQHLPLNKTIREFQKTFAKYAVYKKDGLIDGINKLKSTFDQVYLDELYYFDFYAIDRFGKTKLGYYLLYSKQGQSMSFMKQLINDVKPRIERIISTQKFDAIAFVPATVKRELQIMKLLQQECYFGLPIIEIQKIKTPIIVPQKTLSKLADRVQNARNTMLVTQKVAYDRILLIDDAVGSGSTLNEISAQLKKKNLCQCVVGLALTGSFKGFDVISEV